jgi:lipopolysaccharide export system protein LptA
MLPAVLLFVALCLPSLPVRAEKADRDKPVNVEADRMQYDDLQGINVFTGNVTLTKGTIIIRADRMVLRQDPQGFHYGTAYGHPASFRQRRDVPDQFVEGYGLQIDWDGKQEVVYLRQKSMLKRLDKERVTDEAHGNLIVYESLSEFFTVESGSSPAPTAGNPSGRVRVVIQPRTPSAGATEPLPAAPLELKRNDERSPQSER